MASTYAILYSLTYSIPLIHMEGLDLLAKLDRQTTGITSFDGTN